MKRAKKHYEYDEICKHRDYPQRELPVTIMNCGHTMGSYPLTFNQAWLPVNGFSPAIPYGGPSTVLGSVTLDTSGLLHPAIKINFSSLISTRTNQVYAYLGLVFTLKRICGNQCVEVGSWRYDNCNYGADAVEMQAGGILRTETFSFEHCECGACPDCCTYVVELSQEPGYGGFEFAIISKINLSATAVGVPK